MLAGMGLLSTIDGRTGTVLLGLYMAVLGIGVGMLMQNLVLAAQNDVPRPRPGGHHLGADLLPQHGRRRRRERPGRGAGQPDHHAHDGEARPVGRRRLGRRERRRTRHLQTARSRRPRRPRTCTRRPPPTCSSSACRSPPLALVAVLFIKEKPLNTLSGEERLVRERATAAGH
ncbi:hypothetical protein [Streptosporangium vulgare]|uniref:hypothetical protein n=1 Tax=Streptosporangium vulgare TaxID=46190 RepID=UPI0031DF60A9